MLTVGGGATLPHKLAGIGMKAVGPLPTYLDKVSLDVHTMQLESTAQVQRVHTFVARLAIGTFDAEGTHVP
jgi:hypothetical protein